MDGVSQNCFLELKESRPQQGGQAVLEYVLLFSIVASVFVVIIQAMPFILAKLEKPIKEKFVFAYKYGHPEACGYEDPPPCSGTPKKHPRYYLPDNFRLFSRGE